MHRESRGGGLGYLLQKKCSPWRYSKMAAIYFAFQHGFKYATYGDEADSLSKFLLQRCRLVSPDWQNILKQPSMIIGGEIVLSLCRGDRDYDEEDEKTAEQGEDYLDFWSCT